MSTLGVILALAAVSLQGNAAVEGPLEPEPLWGDDIHVWDMGADSSTYICPGMEYCDMYSHEDTLYAIAIRRGVNFDRFHIYWSLDSYSWTRARSITNLQTTYSPNMRVTDNGDILYVSSCERNTGTGRFLVFRYDMPGFSNFMYSQLSLPSGSDTVCTAEIVENIDTGEFWLLGTDISGDMFLSISTDSCKTWGEFTQVLSDATMHAAYSDNSGNIYVAYRDLGTNEAKLAVFSDPDTWDIHTIGQAASDASPKIAVYRDVVTTIAVTYHDQDNEVVLAVSSDMGSSWAIQAYDEGRYPNIDIDRLSGECGLCFVGPLAVTINVATAPRVAQIFEATAQPASDMPAFAMGPAVIRHDYYGEEYGLLYMGRTDSGYPKDLWFDSSLFTGIEEGGPVGEQPVSLRPNPSPGTFTVSFQLAQPRQAAVSIYSADGRLVDEIFSGVTSGEDIDVARELPAGVYTVVLRTESGVSSRRVVSL